MFKVTNRNSRISIPKVNIGNIIGDLTPAKFRNLIFTELQPIQSQSFTSDSDENHHISTVIPVNYKEINLDNTNMNTSTMKDDLRDKSTDIVLKKCNDNSILEHLEEVKKKKMTMKLSSSV